VVSNPGFFPPLLAGFPKLIENLALKAALPGWGGHPGRAVKILNHFSLKKSRVFQKIIYFGSRASPAIPSP
jgi:hypothetical protein